MSSIEVVISILIIVLITATLLYTFNPKAGIGVKRNSQRTDDVESILNAVKRMIKDDNGRVPDGIPLGDDCFDSRAQICKTDAVDCTGLVEVKGLDQDGVYLPSIPVDPSSSESSGAGYNIIQNESGLVTVCAPLSENGEKISISSK